MLLGLIGADAQSGFESSLTGNTDFTAYECLELPNGHLVFIGPENLLNGIGRSKMVLLDGAGNFLGENTLALDSVSLLSTRLLYHQGYLIALGYADDLRTDSSFLHYVRLDENLTVLGQRFHDLGMADLFIVNALIDETTENIIAAGTGNKTQGGISNAPFAARLNLEGELLFLVVCKKRDNMNSFFSSNAS